MQFLKIQNQGLGQVRCSYLSLGSSKVKTKLKKYGRHIMILCILDVVVSMAMGKELMREDWGIEYEMQKVHYYQGIQVFRHM